MTRRPPPRGQAEGVLTGGRAYVLETVSLLRQENGSGRVVKCSRFGLTDRGRDRALW